MLLRLRLMKLQPVEFEVYLREVDYLYQKVLVSSQIWLSRLTQESVNVNPSVDPPNRLELEKARLEMGLFFGINVKVLKVLIRKGRDSALMLDPT